MRAALISVILFALLLVVVPSEAIGDTQDNCRRVGAYINRVANLIERSAPSIIRSGNERAVALLVSAISELRAARRAYNNEQCRIAFIHAQQAEHLILRALRLIHHRLLT